MPVSNPKEGRTKSPSATVDSIISKIHSYSFEIVIGAINVAEDAAVVPDVDCAKALKVNAITALADIFIIKFVTIFLIFRGAISFKKHKKIDEIHK